MVDQLLGNNLFIIGLRQDSKASIAALLRGSKEDVVELRQVSRVRREEL